MRLFNDRRAMTYLCGQRYETVTARLTMLKIQRKREITAVASWVLGALVIAYVMSPDQPVQLEL